MCACLSCTVQAMNASVLAKCTCYQRGGEWNRQQKALQQGDIPTRKLNVTSFEWHFFCSSVYTRGGTGLKHYMATGNPKSDGCTIRWLYIPQRNVDLLVSNKKNPPICLQTKSTLIKKSKHFTFFICCFSWQLSSRAVPD